MPALTTYNPDALRNLLDALSPNLALALSEALNVEVILDAATVEPVPVTDMLMASSAGLHTVFSLNTLVGMESVFQISEEAALVMADLLGGGDGQNPAALLDEAAATLLQPAMQGLARGFATALTNQSGNTIEIEGCASQAGALALPPAFALSESALSANLPLSITGVLDAELVFLFTAEMAAALTPESEVESAGDDILSEDELAAMLSGMESEISSPAPPVKAAPATPSFVGSGAAAPPFANFPTGGGSGYSRGMDLLLDIPLDVTVELGRVRMLIEDVLELSSGSIIELDRVAGEPVDLLVNGRLIAKGEVVVIEDNFGIRLTEIISPADRVAGLGKGR